MNVCQILEHPAPTFHLVLWGSLLGVVVTLVSLRWLQVAMRNGAMWPSVLWLKRRATGSGIRLAMRRAVVLTGWKQLEKHEEQALQAQCDDRMVCLFCWEGRHPGLTYPPSWKRCWCPTHAAVQAEQKEGALISISLFPEEEREHIMTQATASLPRLATGGAGGSGRHHYLSYDGPEGDEPAKRRAALRQRIASALEKMKRQEHPSGWVRFSHQTEEDSDELAILSQIFGCTPNAEEREQ